MERRFENTVKAIFNTSCELLGFIRKVGGTNPMVGGVNSMGRTD